MHRYTPLVLATITTAVLAGCSATQQTETIPATPLVPAEAGSDENVVAQAPPEPLAIGDDAPLMHPNFPSTTGSRVLRSMTSYAGRCTSWNFGPRGALHVLHQCPT